MKLKNLLLVLSFCCSLNAQELSMEESIKDGIKKLVLATKDINTSKGELDTKYSNIFGPKRVEIRKLSEISENNMTFTAYSVSMIWLKGDDKFVFLVNCEETIMNTIRGLLGQEKVYDEDCLEATRTILLHESMFANKKTLAVSMSRSHVDYLRPSMVYVVERN